MLLLAACGEREGLVKAQSLYRENPGPRELIVNFQLLKSSFVPWKLHRRRNGC